MARQGVPKEERSVSTRHGSPRGTFDPDDRALTGGGAGNNLEVSFGKTTVDPVPPHKPGGRPRAPP
jgi:hypothetical protein